MSSSDADPMDTAAPISEQAAQWWVVLHGEGCTPSDRYRFAEWVERSPERVEAYLRVAALMSALHSGEVRWPDVPAEMLIREATRASADVVPLGMMDRDDSFQASAKTVSHRKRIVARRLWFSGFAAAVVLAMVAVLLVAIGPARYQTALGEQRSVLIDDGSLVTLNTASRIEVNLQKNRRMVHLLQGEALFQVAPDVARPFDVITGDATIRAVGTQFNVDRRVARTTVTVLEGRVVIDRQESRPATGQSSLPAETVPVSLGAAERLVITASGLGVPEPIANLATATAWTQRRLVFERLPLGEVTEEFNRYNRRHIYIEDVELHSQEVTGVFQANDVASFLTFLSGIADVHIEETADGDHLVLLRPKNISAAEGPD